ncbi:MAG: hypothetical protein ACJ789_01570 [Thermomicrobiales bacterium]
MGQAASLRHYSFSERLIGGALLDSDVYNDIRDDQTANKQALLVLLLPTSFGQVLRFLHHPDRGVKHLLFDLAFFFVLAVALFGIAHFWMNPATSRAKLPGFFRTFAFSNAPNLLLILSPVPVLGGYMFAISEIWSIPTTIMAVRQALGLSLLRSIAVSVLASLAALAGILVLPITVFFT